MAPLRSTLTSTLIAAFPLLGVAVCGVAACGGSSQDAKSADEAGSITCPAPIGPVAKESCADVAKDYDVIAVDAALKHAGDGPSAERVATALKEAGALAAALKQQRTALCEESNACKVTPKEHEAREKALIDLMNELVKLWDKRALSDVASVERFRDEVRALSNSAGIGGGNGAGTGVAKPGGAAEPSAKIAVTSMAKISSDSAVVFKDEGDGVSVSIKDAAAHDALRITAEQAKLVAGRRYQIKVTGSYSAGTKPLFSPGDEIKVRLKHRATAACTLFAAARSLEDPESDESITEWKLAAGEKGSREALLTAPPGGTGVYVGFGLKGPGSIELDDVELLRGDQVIVAARGEADAEPNVKTTCAPSSASPIAGKRSLRCDGRGSGDLLLVGLPASHVFMAARGGGGQRADLAVVRTTSLDGGRSIDATINGDSEIVLGLSGPGSAVFRSIEIRELPR